VGRAKGVSEAQMLALPDYRESGAFTALEKLVIEYTERMTLTPVEVPDKVFCRASCTSGQRPTGGTYGHHSLGKLSRAI
jgi:hypothetical protein